VPVGLDHGAGGAVVHGAWGARGTAMVVAEARKTKNQSQVSAGSDKW
jgi:hypothetical protein